MLVKELTYSSITQFVTAIVSRVLTQNEQEIFAEV